MSRGDERSESSRAKARDLAALALLLIVLLSACRQKMANQPRYDPLEASDFFADGMSARPRVAGTVARGELSTDPFFDTGKINGQIADGFPMPITLDVVNRGEQRFNIYCSQCHGRTGDGNGMIPSRGFRRPPSFHTETVRSRPNGHYFDVMTNGFGAMPPYGTMVSPRDRWAIVAYIRALQLSQNATVADVPAGALGARASSPQPPGGTPAPHGEAH